MRKTYNVEKTEKVELGRFKINLDTVVEGEKQYPYSYISMKKSVGILPFYKGNILLINQYRHSIKSYELEIPGGGIDNEQVPEEVAKIELLEETGYVVDSLVYLGNYYPSPGSSDEITYLYAAQCHPYCEPRREPLEYMEQLLIDEEEMKRLIISGKFKHSMGLVAWLKYMLSKED